MMLESWMIFCRPAGAFRVYRLTGGGASLAPGYSLLTLRVRC